MTAEGTIPDPAPADAREAPESATRGLVPWLAPAVAVGLALRLYGLRDQVLGGDELHALRTAADLPLAQILVTYVPNLGNAIPLTAFYRILLVSGVGLGEWAARLPSLVAGAASLVLIPWLLAPRLGRRSTALLAWLLALSPGLVLYSRIARSYMPVVLLGFVAVLAFERWLRAGSRRAAAVYLASALLAVHLHLAMGPFVVAPFAYAIGERLFARRPGAPSLAAIAGLAGAFVLGLAVLLLPAAESLVALVARVRQERPVDLATLSGAVALMAGTRDPVLIALLGLAAVRGVGVSLRAWPRTAALIAVVSVVDVVGLILLSPYQLHQPLMFGRYVLPLLPFALAFVAVGLGHPLRPGPGARRIQLGFGVALLAAVFLRGPFADRPFFVTSFAHHNDYVGFHRSRGTLAPEQIPAFYRDVARGDAAGALVEYPWNTWWNFSRAPRIYQEHHEQRVLASAPEAWLYGPGFALRNTVEPDPERLLASDARWLVVHRDPVGEELRVREGVGSLAAELDPELTRRFRRDGTRFGGSLHRVLVRRWGPPDHEDPDVWAWDLSRVRAAAR